MTTAADVAALFLRDVSAPVTPGNVRAVSVWIAHENSNPTLRNNPLNLHSWGGLTGQVGAVNVSSGDRDVAVFDTIEHGVAADAANLLHAGYYTSAVDRLRSNDPAGFLSAIAASPWSAGHYRIGGAPGTNSLLRDFNGTGEYGGSTIASAGGSSAWAPSAALVAAAAPARAGAEPCATLSRPGSNVALWAVLALVVIIAAS